MSKKLYASKRWKKRIALAQAREARKAHRRPSRYRRIPPRGFRGTEVITITPPEVLSLLKNPVETIRFLRHLEIQVLRGARVFIEFEQVSTITPDAPLALLGTMKRLPERTIRGSVPLLPETRAILEQSGFFDHVRHGFDIQADCKGVIAKHTGMTVDGALARDLILRGTELLYGQRHDSEPSYGIILEGMENTVAHAHQRREYFRTSILSRESWWASVYVDRGRNRICFAVLDLGVGILKSARVKAWRQLDLALRKAADSEVLRELLLGKLPSRTGLPNRGKGLPSIKNLSDIGAIKSCTIVANSVCAELETNDFRVMSESFSGTLLYWEI